MKERDDHGRLSGLARPENIKILIPFMRQCRKTLTKFVMGALISSALAYYEDSQENIDLMTDQITNDVNLLSPHLQEKSIDKNLVPKRQISEA